MMRLLLLDLILIRGWALGMNRRRATTALPIVLTCFLLMVLSIFSVLVMLLRFHSGYLKIYGIPPWLARPVNNYIRGETYKSLVHTNTKGETKYNYIRGK